MDKKRKQMLQEAYNSVPMYYRLADNAGIDMESIIENDEWEKVPFLEKDWIISEGTSALTAEGAVLQMQGKLMYQRTSGSTGKCMDIYWKKKDYNKSMLPLWYYRYRYYGIRPEDRCCFFYTIRELGKEEKRFFRDKNTLGFSKSHVSMEELCDVLAQMREFQPKWLMLQPSIAILLCDCMERYNIEPIDSIKYIEFTGEILTQTVRNMTIKHFKCQIADQYGANEFNSIAYECPCGKKHILSQNVLVEVRKDGKEVPSGERGELYITSYTNSVMPLIRYRIGDYGRVTHNHSCACGNHAPILELESGRTVDYISGPDGERISIYALIRAVDSLNCLGEGVIKQYQFVQRAADHIHVRLVVDDEYDENDLAGAEGKDRLCERFLSYVEDERLRKMKFSFEFFSKLLPEETGKVRCFVKEI